MKKILIAALLMACTSTSFASYTYMYKLDKTGGGIQFKASTNQTTTPTPTPTPTPVVTQPSPTTAWEAFADKNGLPKNWTNLAWGSKGLKTLPTEDYPVSVMDEMVLNNNSFTNVDGFRTLTRVNGSVNLYVGSLDNLNGFSNLTYVGVNVSVRNNAITDITGLRNAEIKGMINIDTNYRGPKMEANSRFCTLNAANRFSSSFAQKSVVCK